MYRPTLIAPPAALPVSLAEAKAHLRVDHADEDALIGGYLAAATAHLDGWGGILGRCLVSQTWRQDFDDFDRCMRIALAPVVSISSVKHLDAAGDEQTVGTSNYALRVDDLGPFVRFKHDYAFPAVYSEPPAVMVTYVAGYGPAAQVDARARQAILLLVMHWYENRAEVVLGATVARLPMAVDALLAPLRRNRF